MIFNSKDPGETELFGFDFISLLSSGETLLTAVFAISSPDGVSSAGMLVSTGIISGTVASQMVTGGILHATYTLQCTATTSFGQTLMLCGDIPIMTC